MRIESDARYDGKRIEGRRKHQHSLTRLRSDPVLPPMMPLESALEDMLVSAGICSDSVLVVVS